MKLTTRDRALSDAVAIIEARAVEIENVYEGWKVKHPEDELGAATERSAYLECQLLARLVRERMSPAGRRALSSKGSDE